MIISHSKQFINIKNKKVAGCSVSEWLENYCDRDKDDILTYSYQYSEKPNVYQLKDPHQNAIQIKRAVGEELWEQYFTFAFERNPWDKMVSAYYYFLNRNHSPFARKGFKHYLRSKQRGRIGGKEFYSHNGKIIVDKVYLFEQLHESLEDICKVLGFKERCPLPNSRNTKFRPKPDNYVDYYDEEDKKWVEDHFWFEIETFGYKFGE